MNDQCDQYEIKDLTCFEEMRTETTGARKKVWLDVQGTPWLFKESKNTESVEYIAEKIACELCRPLSLPYAETILARYQGKIGSASRNVLSGRGLCTLHEFKSLVKAEFSFHSSSDKSWYKDHNIVYNTDLIAGVINEINGDIFPSFIKTMIFDFLISNSDRHHSNWAVITNESTGLSEFCPLYDSGSGLFSTNPESTVTKMLSSKHFVNYIAGASSMVRHREVANTNFKALLNSLIKYYPNIVREFNNEIQLLWTDNFIELTLDRLGGIATENRKLLMCRLLKTSREMLLKACGG